MDLIRFESLLVQNVEVILATGTFCKQYSSIFRFLKKLNVIWNNNETIRFEALSETPFRKKVTFVSLPRQLFS